MMGGSVSGSVQIIMVPDPGGPKTYWYGSTTLELRVILGMVKAEPK
jgi:hypothetical protein